MKIDAGPVCLRPVEERDAPAVAALMSPAISQWVLSWPDVLTADEAAGRIARVRADVQAGGGHYFVIERAADHAVVGWISITIWRDEPGRGALGYWIGEAFQGHGFMSAAAAAVLELAFETMKLDVVEAGANMANDRSFAIMRRLGMKPSTERTLWSSSRCRHEVCRFYEIKRADYEAAQRKRSVQR